MRIDSSLVRRLIEAQFPRLSRLAVREVESSGTDNAIFRLGDELCVRLPKVDWAIAQVAKEQQWLPKIAPSVSVEIPRPVESGAPGEGYPWRWSIYSWIDGENPGPGDGHDEQLAKDFASFLAELHNVETPGGPPPGEHNFFRGEPLARRDSSTRKAIASLGDKIDAGAVTSVWEQTLEATVYDGEPIWIHGDPQGGNLLLRDGRLHAVIDFGGLGVGDPACDLIVAWNFFTSNAREALRRALDVDDATWKRGRGWALTNALVALPFYENKNLVMAEMARRTLSEVLSATRE